MFVMEDLNSTSPTTRFNPTNHQMSNLSASDLDQVLIWLSSFECNTKRKQILSVMWWVHLLGSKKSAAPPVARERETRKKSEKKTNYCMDSVEWRWHRRWEIIKNSYPFRLLKITSLWSRKWEPKTDTREGSDRATGAITNNKRAENEKRTKSDDKNWK